MRYLITVVTIILVLTMQNVVSANEPVKVFVADFNVVGSIQTDKNDLKLILQSLIRSQVTDSDVLAVDFEKDADFIIKGTYISFSGFNNIDTSIVSNSGISLARVSKNFVDQKKLIETISGLSRELHKEIKAQSVLLVKNYPKTIQIKPAAAIEASQTPNLIVRQSEIKKTTLNTNKIKLDGKFNLLSHATIERKSVLIVTSDRAISIFDLAGKKLSSKEWPVGTTIIHLDAYRDGNYDYLIVNKSYLGEALTDIYRLTPQGFETLAADQAYFVSTRYNSKGQYQLYVQEQGSGSEQFYGTVYEATLSNRKLIKGKSLRLPRYANVFNFQMVALQNGEEFIVAFDGDRYLNVYDSSQKKVWKSMDKFGGSELFYQVKGGLNYKATGKDSTTYFMEQRIQKISDDTIVVVKNDGALVVGDARVYKKGSVYALKWTGTELEEVWRTKDFQNYLADCYLNYEKNEMYQLLVTQREDMVNNDRASSLIQIQSLSQ